MTRQMGQYGRWVWERRVLGQVASPGRGVRTWLGISGRRPVVLLSPHPVSECLQRLEKVTTSRGSMTWYLDPKTVGRPDPRFRGQVGQSQIRLVRFTAGGARSGPFAVLDAWPKPGADGGTTLSGWIGMPRAAQVIWSVCIGGGTGLVSLVLLVAGVAQLALGHLIGLAPAATFPLPVIAWAGVNVMNLQAIERDISKLLKQVNEVLDSTAAFPVHSLSRRSAATTHNIRTGVKFPLPMTWLF